MNKTAFVQDWEGKYHDVSPAKTIKYVLPVNFLKNKLSYC
jgi:hypothetical protein